MKKFIYSTLLASGMLMGGVGASDANASWLNNDRPCHYFRIHSLEAREKQ